MKLEVYKRKINTLINRPETLLIKVLYSISPFIGDRLYLKLLFPLKVGYRLNLENPKTFNEKLQWLKLYYRKPWFKNLVDKYEAKTVVEKLIGKEYVVESYGVWDSFDAIDFSVLPSQFVLKTTHDQGGVVICKDKENFDFDWAKKILNKHLKTGHFKFSREWPYKDVKPRIMAEKYLEEENIEELRDYKFFCFDGVIKAMFIASERRSGEEVKFDFYDRNFNSLDIIQQHPKSGNKFSKPENFDKMKKLAEELSSGHPHMRIDFYNIDGSIYFGEFTFYHHGGLVSFHPSKWDEIFGSWISLPSQKSV